MKQRSLHRFVLVLAFVFGAPAVAVACLWDYDTLRQERARFPSTLELITGKFLRHSKEFYEWRIHDRLHKLAADPSNLSHHDDLAVAYEKIGQHSKAVETILAKEKIKPGLYETYSNLGTFHILAGDFELGLPFIDKALAINPDAHFGRERYQKWLVEYALMQRRDGKVQFPLRNSEAGRGEGGFQYFLRERLEKKLPLSEAELQPAIKGILGMMRFANHANPLLLEALGDLLCEGKREVDGKQLAARCYLKASYEVADPVVKKAYHALAERALDMQSRPWSGDAQIPLADIEAEFAAELADGEAWYSDLRAKEIGWIREGKDADFEFDRLYTQDPTIADGDSEMLVYGLVSGVGFVAMMLVGVGLLVWLRRRGKDV